ncbi:MAG: ATP-binding protein, partial [Alistipes putredinis]
FRLGRSFSQSYDIRLDDGTVKTYSYWFADLQALNTNSDAGTGPASE